MAPHSSTLAWKIPWAEEPGGLQSMGLLSRIWLSDFTFTFHFHALEKEMATHSSVLAWRTPAKGEPSALPLSGVTQSWTRLSDFTFTFHFHALEKEMTTHSSVLAWRTPGAGEPGGLTSMGSQRIRHDWSDLAAAAYTSIKLILKKYHKKLKLAMDVLILKEYMRYMV